MACRKWACDIVPDGWLRSNCVWAVLLDERAFLSEKGAVTMKYCEKCGRKVDTDADICPYCGAPLREMQDGELSEEELLMLLGLL